VYPKRLQAKDTQVTGFTIDSIGRGNYYGFTLNGDHLYFCANDFTITHNTTLTCQFISAIAQQLHSRGEDKEILLLTNEGSYKRLASRVMQAVFQEDEGVLDTRAKEGNLQEEYLKRVGTNTRVRVIPIGTKKWPEVAQVIEMFNPAAVFIDLLSNVKPAFPAERKDLSVEEVFKDCRIHANEFGYTVFPVTQLSAEAAGKMFPPMSCVADARAGVVRSADEAIFLGHDGKNETYLGISTYKGKLAKKGSPGNVACLADCYLSLDRDKATFHTILEESATLDLEVPTATPSPLAAVAMPPVTEAAPTPYV